MPVYHRTQRLQIYGEKPEVTQLFNDRYRMVVRCKAARDTEAWYNDNKSQIFADFGTLYNAQMSIDGIDSRTGEAYDNMVLVSNAVGYTQTGEYVVTFVYETLTATWTKEKEDTVSSTDNGLRIVERSEVATIAATAPYDEDDIGTSTITSGGKTLYLAGFKDETKSEADAQIGRVTTQWLEAGIVRVQTPKVGGQQQVVVQAIGMSETEVAAAISEVTENHQLIDVSKENHEGFQTSTYTYEVDDFTVMIAAEDDLTAIRKTTLSASDIVRGTINSTAISYGGTSYLLRQEELDNSGIIKKSVRIFVAYENDSFPALELYEIDSRYGIAVPVERQVKAIDVQGEITGSHAIQVEPVDAFRSLSYKILASDVPASQTWYEYRQVNIFPSELADITVVGNTATSGTAPAVFVNYNEPPSSPLKIKITRNFHWGEPVDSTIGTERTFKPKSFSGGVVVEVGRTSESTSESTNSGSSSSTNSSTSSSTNSGTSSSTNSGTSSSTNSGTSTGTSESTSESTNTGTSESTNIGTSSSTSESTNKSNSTGNSTNSSVNSGTSSTTSESTGESTNSGTSSSTGKSEGNTQNQSQSQSVNNTQSSSYGNSTSYNTYSGIYNETQSTSESTSKSQPISESNGWSVSVNSSSRTSESLSARTSTSTNSGTSTNESTSSGTSESISNTTSNSSSTNSGTSSNTNSGTNQSTNSGTSSSTNSSTSESTNTGTSESTNSGTSESTNTGTSESISNGTNSSTNSSTSTTTSTSKSIVTVNIRPCLTSARTVTILGESINIPATTPTSLPTNSYTLISRRASHWKYNIWVEEIEEVYLPA